MDIPTQAKTGLEWATTLPSTNVRNLLISAEMVRADD
jgi:hypothetical protein